MIGDREWAPALERVIFSMKNSVNFFGSVNLSTLNPTTGKSSLQQLVFNTPAMYGLGAAGDVASVSTDTLVWNGVADAPAGTSLAGRNRLGRLDLRARRIMLGDANGTPLTPHLNMKRLALGFSQVTLDATERISANGEGSVGVYQSRGSYSNGAFSYSGGDLVLRTPLLTGEAASVSRITAGGALRLSGAGQAVSAPRPSADRCIWSRTASRWTAPSPCPAAN